MNVQDSKFETFNGNFLFSLKWKFNYFFSHSRYQFLIHDLILDDEILQCIIYSIFHLFSEFSLSRLKTRWMEQEWKTCMNMIINIHIIFSPYTVKIVKIPGKIIWWQKNKKYVQLKFRHHHLQLENWTRIVFHSIHTQ